MNSIIQCKGNGQTTARVVTDNLTRQGLRVVRSFDLRSALVAHTGCECPYHGTDDCTCQFVVLLVYNGAAEPVVLTIHSCDADTSVQLVGDGLSRPDPALTQRVLTVLREVALSQPGPSGQTDVTFLV